MKDIFNTIYAVLFLWWHWQKFSQEFRIMALKEIRRIRGKGPTIQDEPQGGVELE